MEICLIFYLLIIPMPLKTSRITKIQLSLSNQMLMQQTDNYQSISYVYVLRQYVLRKIDHREYRFSYFNNPSA